MDSSDLIAETSLQSNDPDLQEADKLYFQSRYFDAYRVYQTVLDRVSGSIENNSTKLQTLYYKLGLSSLKIGKYTDAHDFLDKALDILKSSGDNILERARIFNAMGKIYEIEAKFSESEQVYKNSIELISGHCGKKHKELIVCYNGLASLNEVQTKYKEALEYLNRAVEIDSADDIDVAKSYFLFATIYWYQDKNDKSSEYIEKCLSIRKRIYGEEHVKIAHCYKILGHLEKDKNKLFKALEYYQRGLKMLTEFLGDNNIGIANFYSGIGRVYLQMDERAESLQYHKKSLKIKKEFWIEDHPDLANTYYDIADTYTEQSKFEKALTFYHKTEKIISDKFGKNHLRIAMIFGSIADAYYKQDQYIQAIEWVEKKLAIEISNHGPASIELTGTFNRIALFYFKSGKYKEAVQSTLKNLRLFNADFKNYLDVVVVNFFNVSHILGCVQDLRSHPKMLQRALTADKEARATDYLRTNKMMEDLEEVQRKNCLQDLNNNLRI